MMAVQQVFSLFSDVWQLYRSFAGRKLTEAEKEDFINQAGRIGKKYSWELLAKDVIAAVYREIDRQVKEDSETAGSNKLE